MRLECLVLIGPVEISLLNGDMKAWIGSVKTVVGMIHMGENLVTVDFVESLARKMCDVWNGLIDEDFDVIRFKSGTEQVVITGGSVNEGRLPQGYGYETMSLSEKCGLTTLAGIRVVEKL